MKKRCCIIGAAPINNYELIKTYFTKVDFFIFCDGGMSHKDQLGIEPDLIVGDFDSYKKEDFLQETIVLPHVKDDTDTYYAAKEALKRGFKEFLIIGCIGKRLDHSMANLGLLFMLHNNGANAILIDDYGELEILGDKPLFIPPSFPYFSLMNIDGDTHGIYIENALYPLDNASFTTSYPLGISNEPLPGKTAKVWVTNGKLLLYRVFDS